MQLDVFSWALTLLRPVIVLHDAVVGAVRKLRQPAGAEHFFFASGGRKLAAVWVSGGDSAPVVLICHGIGEGVGHWSATQAWLEERGVSSMIFNYSGYGSSTGRIRAEHCDQDLVAAYAEVRRRVGAERPVWVLGFSMGSGVAGSGVAALRPAAAGLFLCEAFPSFREAARAAWVPQWATRLGPDVWRTEDAMRTIAMPVCVIHSDGDRLFPVAMGRRLAEAAGKWGELVVVRGMGHSEPYLRPTEEYWGAVVRRVREAQRAL